MTNIDPRDQYDQLPSRLLVPKRSYIAQRPYFATYSGTTIANLNAQIAALNVSLGNMTASRDTWQQRANTAYDSGTWAAGTPWQTDYSNMVAQRDAVQAQLNAANAGIQPQINAAVAAVQAHGIWTTVQGINGTAQPDNMTVMPINSPGSGQCVTGDNTYLYTSINGYYAFGGALWLQRQGDGGGDFSARLLLNGGEVMRTQVGNNTHGNVQMPLYYVQLMGAGQQIRVEAQASNRGAAGIGGTSQLQCTFIPTPQYPH